MTPDPDSRWLVERAHAGREHFDAEHARRYDVKENAEAAAENRSTRALPHLPDFWKAIALQRMAPGGALRLWDVVYNFEPADAEQRIET